jgi:hypothetical protein
MFLNYMSSKHIYFEEKLAGKISQLSVRKVRESVCQGHKSACRDSKSACIARESAIRGLEIVAEA